MAQPDHHVLIGKGETPQFLDLGLANRHGLIAGATGTGKTVFWDLFGEQGHRVRTTVSEMGPVLLARLLGVNETQEGVLAVAFEFADDQGLLLLDLKDLRALMNFVGEHANELSIQYGRVSTSSVGAIQRKLLMLEQQGGDHFFGEPAFDIQELMRTDLSGQGIINVLATDRLMASPKLYATFLLWLLSELFEDLPEVGDPPQPRLVFFFDEAHLLFEEAPKALLDKVEQVVRLIRSKGVGVYFCTQNPLDIPDDVLGQLGNRLQHALRAFTPRDQRAVRAAAETFRANPKLDVSEAITQLGVGEALVSTLHDKGVPSIVERTLICPPSSRIGPATAEERQTVMSRSPVGGRYDQPVDRESAYEVLRQRAERVAADAAAAQEAARAPQEAAAADGGSRSGGRQRQSPLEAMVTSAARSIGSQIGRQLLRGVLGSLTRR